MCDFPVREPSAHPIILPDMRPRPGVLTGYHRFESGAGHSTPMRLRAARSGRPFGWVAEDCACPGGVQQGLASARHGVRMHPPREGAGQPFPVACPGGFHGRPGRFPCPVWCLEMLAASACSIQGGNTKGVTHEAAKCWVPERSKTRIRRTGCGVEQFPCRRRARQHPISCAGWGSSPTQQWEEFPESSRAALAQSAGVTAETADPRVVGAVLGVVRRIMWQCARVAPCALPSETGGAGRRAHRICGAGAPHRHAATGLRRDAGWEHPACRRPIRNGWWHTPVRGRPSDGPLV